MKKNLLAGLLLLWACSVYGQKRIVDPVRSDFSYVAKFDRVEITGKRTVAEVTLRYLPNYWIRYDSLTTYLQDCGTGCWPRKASNSIRKCICPNRAR